jgi:hypothetical protein
VADVAVGDQWNEEALVAPFSFPILRSEKDIAIEQQKIAEDFYAFFILQSNLLPIIKSRLNEQLENLIEPDSAESSDLSEYANAGNLILDRVYQTGIVDSVPIQWNKSYVNLVNGNQTNLIKREKLKNKEQGLAVARELLRTSKLRDKSGLLAILSDVMQPNVLYSKDLTTRFLLQEQEKISKTMGKVDQGETIISTGEVITQTTYMKILSLDTYYDQEIGGKNERWLIFSGYLLLTVILIGLLLLYLAIHYEGIFAKYSSLAFMLFWAVLYSYLVYVVEQTDNLSTYLIPFCIIPIVVKNFYNDSLALYVHLVIVMIASFLSKLGYEFTFLQLLAGVVTILVVQETRFWGRFFQSIIYITLTYALGYLGISLIGTGDLSQIDWSMYLWFLISGVLTLLAYPLIPLLERVFGYTSSITLAELNDLNHPLLRDLSVKAPGTLQHSIQVANLSEAAADAIGANSLKVRVGALYHDVGKMLHPEYFIENQSGVNPHDDKTEKESASIIIEHVTAGAKMASKHRLPKVIIDFILTHHGTTRVEYFYRTYAAKYPNEKIELKDFTYPGPKPSTKEQAILMLADSLEAAAKSLKNPTGVDIDQLVDKISASKIDQGQLDEANLTFREFQKCLSVFKSTLRSIHHVRIEYPPEVKPSEDLKQS